MLDQSKFRVQAYAAKAAFLNKALNLNYGGLCTQMVGKEKKWGRMLEITEQLIDTNSVLASVQADRAGAAVLFLGTTRQFTDQRETELLEYECYPEMALKKMAKLREQAMTKWPIELCAIVHRIGIVPVGEASVAIAVSTPHRSDAFEAGQWLIDQLKQTVPIWKKEIYTDGQQEWVHPQK